MLYGVIKYQFETTCFISSLSTLILGRHYMKDLLKNPLKAVAVVVGIILLLIIARIAYNYLYYTLPPQQVNVSVKYSPGATCRVDSPIYMLITNDSSREIISTSFSLSVKKRINSDNFIQLLARNYSTDKIIKAGSSYGGCWAYPKLNTDHYVPEELIYEINGKQIMFRV